MRDEVDVKGTDHALHVDAEHEADREGSTDQYLQLERCHEFGRSLGLDNEEFSGVDSYTYDFSEYKSVINYNADEGVLDFNGGGSFDDWAGIEEHFSVSGE